MPNFTVRMVLHRANSDDYAQLEEEMRNIGFVDQITGSSGKTYTLPDAEYYGSASDIDTAFEKAKSAARAVGLKHAIFVTQAASTKWVGLEEA